MTDRNNITLSQVSNDNLLHSNNWAELNIQAHKPAVHPEFSMFAARMNTYERWPASIPQKPELLAIAGFYYSGTGDQVKCFHCGISLCKWEPTDDPWIEHARWFPGCAYICQILSQDFISLCIICKNEARKLKLGINDTLPGNRIKVYDPCIRIFGNPVGGSIQNIAEIYGDFPIAYSLLESRANVQVDETSFSTPDNESSPPPQCSSSLSSPHRYYDDAAIDEVTRAILNSVLFNESTDPSISSQPPTNASEAENNDASNIRNADGEDDNALAENKTAKSAPQPNKTEESQSESENRKAISLEEENKMLKKARMCKICMDAEVNIVFLPCGHLVCCVVCSTGLLQCPICRLNIKAVVRTYLS